jgi:hypothetical protein
VNTSQARRILRTLRQGTVSPESVATITVGLERTLDSIDSELDAFQRKGSNHRPLFIEGDWGSGKSHLSMACRRCLAGRQLPWLYQCVDGKGNSLSHFNRCVGKWLESIRIADVHGLRAGIESEVLQKARVKEWAEANYSDFTYGILGALDGLESGWLRALGHLCAIPDASYQKDRALEIFLSAAEMVRQVGGSGIVLLLDELENISREWDVRGRRRAYDLIGALMESKHVKVIAFVTPRLIEQAAADFDRSQAEGQWSARAQSFLESAIRAPRLRVPSLAREDVVFLVRNVKNVYVAASGMQPDLHDFLPRVRAAWERTATKSARLLIRLAVNELDLRTQ